MKVTDEMVTRFLSWPLPDNVQPDGIYPAGDYRKKWGHALTGTNLLDATAAKAMLEHVLAAPDSAKLVSELRRLQHSFLSRKDAKYRHAGNMFNEAANYIEQPAAQDEQPYFDYNAAHGIPAAQPTGELEFLGYVNANAIPRIGEGLYAMVWESADQASKYHDNFVPDGEAVKVYLKCPALDTQTAQPKLEFRNSDGSTDVVDLSPAMRDSNIRDRLIELGWRAPE